jgi:hypothetical protein
MKTIAVFAIGVAFSASPAIAQVNMQYIMVKLASNIRDSTLGGRMARSTSKSMAAQIVINRKVLMKHLSGSRPRIDSV